MVLVNSGVFFQQWLSSDWRILLTGILGLIFFSLLNRSMRILLVLIWVQVIMEFWGFTLSIQHHPNLHIYNAFTPLVFLLQALFYYSVLPSRGALINLSTGYLICTVVFGGFVWKFQTMGFMSRNPYILYSTFASICCVYLLIYNPKGGMFYLVPENWVLLGKLIYQVAIVPLFAMYIYVQQHPNHSLTENLFTQVNSSLSLIQDLLVLVGFLLIPLRHYFPSFKLWKQAA